MEIQVYTCISECRTPCKAMTSQAQYRRIAPTFTYSDQGQKICQNFPCGGSHFAESIWNKQIREHCQYFPWTLYLIHQWLLNCKTKRNTKESNLSDELSKVRHFLNAGSSAKSSLTVVENSGWLDPSSPKYFFTHSERSMIKVNEQVNIGNILLSGVKATLTTVSQMWWSANKQSFFLSFFFQKRKLINA